MRIAYFDCFAGASGDMILAALVDVGLDPDDLRRELAKLPVEGYELRVGRVMKQHLQAADVEVVVHEHVHGRTAAQIEAIVAGSGLDPVVRERASRIIRRLAEAEARIHGKRIDEIHLHEVGGVDCIVDVCGAVAGLALLGVDQVYCSPLPISRGYATFSHGTWPMPGPATLALMEGVPVVPLDVDEETLTPTGAAILTTLAVEFGGVPPMRLERVGYGAGKKTFARPIPNALRLLLGEVAAPGGASVQTLALLETNVDDMPPEWHGHVMERLLGEGALDAWLAPVQMKKNRPGVLLSVLCTLERVDALRDLLYRETTTLGVRITRVERHALDREVIDVPTPWGTARVKVGRTGGQVITIAPEYESCRALAQAGGVALKEVYVAAQAAAWDELGGATASPTEKANGH